MEFAQLYDGLDLQTLTPIRVLMQDWGLATISSCGGHSKHNPRERHVAPYPYIVLDGERNPQDKLDALDDAVQVFNGQWVRQLEALDKSLRSFDTDWILEKGTGFFFGDNAYPIYALHPKDRNEEGDPEKLAALHAFLHRFTLFLKVEARTLELS